MNQINLQNQCAVVTGGAQGIGLAIAERFLASGAAVCLWDRDEPLVRETANSLASKGRVETAVMNVTDLISVRDAVRQTKESLGRIDILVCNAGIAGPTVKLWEYPPEKWQQVIDIDLTGVFNCLKVVSPLMIEQKGRQRCIRRRKGRQSQRGSLQCCKGRGNRLDKIAWEGTRRLQHCR